MFLTSWMGEEYNPMTCKQYIIYVEMVRDQYSLNLIVSEFSRKIFIVDDYGSSVICCNKCLHSMRCEVSTEDLKKYLTQFSHQSVKTDQCFNRTKICLEDRK